MSGSQNSGNGPTDPKQAGMVSGLVQAVRNKLSGAKQTTPINYNPFVQDQPTIPQLSWAASQGQGGDSLLVHTTPGDIVIPQEFMNSQVKTSLLQILGANFDRFTVGSTSNQINSATGLRAFDADGGGGDASNGGDTGGGGSGDNGGFGGGDMSGADNQGASDATGGYGQDQSTGGNGGFGGDMSGADNQAASDATGGYSQSSGDAGGGFFGTDLGAYGLDMSGPAAQSAADAASADATGADAGLTDMTAVNNPANFSLSPEEEAGLTQALNDPNSAKSLDLNPSITGWGFADGLINNFLNNPVASIVNTVLGIAVPGVSEINMGMKAANMIDSDVPSSIGGVVVGAVAGLAAHGDDDQSAQQGQQDQGGANGGGMEAFLTDAAPSPVVPGGAAPNMGSNSDLIQKNQQLQSVAPSPTNPVRNINDFLQHNPFDANSFLGNQGWF